MIKNVLLCGLGAVGVTYANKIQNGSNADLRILVDSNRLERYKKSGIFLNDREITFNYILPQENTFKADFILITTKYDGLADAIDNIKNFVKEDTIIMSLLNGVTSEKIIAEKYGWNKVVLAYWIGHSAIREGNRIYQDGVGKIVFGSKNGNNENIERLKEFFKNSNIEYEVPDDMEHKLWLKYMLNVSSNQPSAILNMTFGDMQNNKEFMAFSKNLMREVQQIAKAEGVKNTDTMIDEALSEFAKMSPEGKTSMLQDVLAKRKTEVDMFAGEMIKFGEKHNIAVPYNKMMYEMIRIIHQNYS